jgi:hypothetical protein
MIKSARCPVILHNGAYDLCHTVDQFWRYLPDNVNEFKTLVNSMWEQIVDTKYLAESHPKLQGRYSSSALGPLYNQAKEELAEASIKISRLTLLWIFSMLFIDLGAFCRLWRRL